MNEYPEVVRDMVALIAQSPATQQLAKSLGEMEQARGPALLVRHFAVRDDLGNAFRVLHAMKLAGITPDREAYRYLMHACCKYHDLDLVIYVMENMLHDQRPDFASFKRLFDACASAVDLRLWVAYDVMMWFYPLRGFPSNALKTTAYITEMMKTVGMHESARAGRGFVTLPNYRGEPADVFAGMFEESDPNYSEPLMLEEGSEAEDHQRSVPLLDLPVEDVNGEIAERWRLRLVAEEFQDRNRMKEIVARNRHRRDGAGGDVVANIDGGHLLSLERNNWSVQVLDETAREEREKEGAAVKLLAANLVQQAQEEARPRKSIREAFKSAWAERKRDAKVQEKQ